MIYSALDKKRVNNLLCVAVYDGRIKRPKKCSNCNKHHKVIEGHHSDYSKPFDVKWLCQPCHKEIHRKPHCPHGHKYTEENTKINSKGHRECLICMKFQKRKYEEKRKLKRLTDRR